MLRIMARRSGRKCEVCGAIWDLQIDHVLPRCRGGDNFPDNLQVLCGPCNRLKSGRPLSNEGLRRLRLTRLMRARMLAERRIRWSG